MKSAIEDALTGNVRNLGVPVTVKGSFKFSYIIIILLIFSLLSPVRNLRCDTVEGLRDHLEQGQELFRKALELDSSDPDMAKDYYTKAIMHFEYIVNEGGVRNGKLYYDIGNAYFRLGDIGRAILNYRRAELYIPDDPNLKQNLEYARSRRVDRIEKSQKTKVFNTLFFFHYDLPSRIKMIVFVISFGLIWAAAVVRLFVPWGGAKVTIVVCSIVAAMFLASLLIEDISLSRRPPGVILDEEVIARKGDAETYQPAFKEPLHSGTEFFLLETREGWLHIQLDNGSDCWVPPGTAELVTAR